MVAAQFARIGRIAADRPNGWRRPKPKPTAAGPTRRLATPSPPPDALRPRKRSATRAGRSPSASSPAHPLMEADEIVQRQGGRKPMAIAEHLELLQQGVDVWNQCRISRTDLHRANLSGADLRGTDLTKADLSETYLDEANLSGAKLGYPHGERRGKLISAHREVS